MRNPIHRRLPRRREQTQERALPATGVAMTASQRRALGAMCGTKSAYVFGPPGSGKTTLLDAIHSDAPSSHRWHFAEFFRELHAALPDHDRSVPATVAALTGDARLVCFDEFHLHDVADAIYLERALRWWSRHGVRIVATSNYRPCDLLPNPLLHDAATPVIAEINATFVVVDVDDGVDHRASRRRPERQGFHAGCWNVTEELAPFRLTATVVVNGRRLAVSETGGAGPGERLSTTFAELCERPWSLSDYIDLLGDAPSLDLTETPDPAIMEREPAQRFANLVDVACDRDVRLDVYSAAGPERLHVAAHPPLDVNRTLSRLSLLHQQ